MKNGKEVAVIGRGCAGLTVARLLAQRGLKVVSFDRPEDTLRASVRALGIIEPQGMNPKPDTHRWYTQALEEYVNLEAAHPELVSVRRINYFHGPENPDTFHWAKLLPAWAKPELLVAGDPRIPEGCDHGISFDAPVIHPQRLIAHWEREAQELGVQFEFLEVPDPFPEDYAGELERLSRFSTVIDCRGIGAAHENRLTPVRGQSLVISGICHGLTEVYGIPGKEFSINIVPRPGNDELVIGASKDVGSLNQTPLAEQRERFLSFLQKNYPQLAELLHTAVFHDMVGFRPVAENGVNIRSVPLPDTGVRIIWNGNGGGGFTHFTAGYDVAAMV